MTKTKRGTPAAAVLSNGIRGWRPERAPRCPCGCGKIGRPANTPQAYGWVYDCAEANADYTGPM